MHDPKLSAAEPQWLRIARAFEASGINEYPGEDAHPFVTGFLEAFTQLRGTPAAESDETAWCSAFVCGCIEMAGIDSPRHALASKWLTWGVETEFRPGCVVVLDHHVTFGLFTTEHRVHCLGGNQSNKVCVKSYPLYDVKGFRWPR